MYASGIPGNVVVNFFHDGKFGWEEDVEVTLLDLIDRRGEKLETSIGSMKNNFFKNMKYERKREPRWRMVDLLKEC